MNLKRIMILLIFFVSIGISDDHKRKHRKIKRNKYYHPSKIHQSSVSMRLNWHWSHWNHWWHDCRIHDRIVVVNQETDNKNKNESFEYPKMEIYGRDASRAKKIILNYKNSLIIDIWIFLYKRKNN